MSPTLDEWYHWVDQQPSCVLLDGGLGELLSKRGNDLGPGSLWSGRLLVTNPKELSDVAALWLRAGSDIVTTATYQVTTKQLREECGLTEDGAESAFHSAVRILHDARGTFWSTLPQSQRDVRRYPKLAASMGPYSAVLPDTDEYSGVYNGVTQSDFYEFHDSRCRVFDKLIHDHDNYHCDIYSFETIGNIEESIAIVSAMAHRSRASVPFWISFQCRDSERIACGEQLSVAVHAALQACSTENLVAIGVNCVNVNYLDKLMEIAREAVQSHMSRLPYQKWRVDLVAYPNSGEVWTDEGWRWLDNEPLHDDRTWAGAVHASGARLIGGCCRIGPSEIESLHVLRSRTK